MTQSATATQRVFIIHGRNLAAVDQLSRFVRALGLEPWPFEEVSRELGRNPVVGEVVARALGAAKAVIALFTPDERATLQRRFYQPQDRGEDRRRFQSRPNVFFETGMALAGAPERTIMVVAGDVELPTDFGGRLIPRLANDAAPRRQLRALLRDAGCHVATDEAFLSTESGDFSDLALFGAETPRLNETSKKKIDVLLSSGGVRALAFAGALQALQRNGYEIEHICGVSGGAVLAASFAARVDSDALVALARSGELFGRLRPPNVLEKLRALLPPFAATKPLEDDFYRRVLGGSPRFEELKLGLGIAALDIRNGRLLAYTTERHKQMAVAEALALSTAVAFYFPWIEAGDRIIVDAALQSQLPLWLLGSFTNPLKNPAVVLSVPLPRAPRPETFGDYMGHLFEASGLAGDHLQVLQSRRLIRIPISVKPHGFLGPLSNADRSDLVNQGALAISEAIERGHFELPDRPARTAILGGTDVHDLAADEAGNAAIRYARELQRFAAELDDD